MISREDLIEQSVTEYLKSAIFTERAYPADQVEVAESFPFTMEPNDEGDRVLNKSLIALGFNFDDQGEQAELGSDLLRRTYTIEFFIFGVTNTYARNLANVIKFALQKDGQIPLRDAQLLTIIDHLEVKGVSAQRQILGNPEPWQEFVWTTTLRVEDLYHASLV